MQDDDSKDKDQPITPEPVAEVPPSPEPQPEQVIEAPVAEPVPEPVPDPIAPEPAPEPIPEPQTLPPTPEPELTPIVVSTPPQPETPPVASVPLQPPTVEQVTPEPVPPIEPTPEQPKEEPVVVPPPTPEPAVGRDGIPQKVLDLSPQELDAARRLWITKNIHSLQKLSTKARHTRKLDLLNEVESFVHANAPVKLSKVAYELNISEPKASDYLRILVKTGRIKAQGQTTSRRYS